MHSARRVARLRVSRSPSPRVVLSRVLSFSVHPTHSMTTPENLEEYRKLYIKCVVRDTPLQESGEGIKAKFTVN